MQFLSPPMPSVFNSTRWPTTRAHADAGDAASRGIVVAAKQLAILAANGSAASEISLRRASLRRKIVPSKPGIRKCRLTCARRRALGRDREGYLDLAHIRGKTGAATHKSILAPSGTLSKFPAFGTRWNAACPLKARTGGSVGKAGPVAHQTASRGEFAPLVDRRNGMARRKRHQPAAPSRLPVDASHLPIRSSSAMAYRDHRGMRPSPICTQSPL
jgi:hypothetical protein